MQELNAAAISLIVKNPTDSTAAGNDGAAAAGMTSWEP